MKPILPLIVEADELKHHLDDESVIVVDVSSPQVYKAGHIPGAIHLRIPDIFSAHDNVDCDIPSDEKLSENFSKLGLLPGHHVVAYRNSCQLRYGPVLIGLVFLTY